MRVLLDESLPRPLARRLTGHHARAVTDMKWTGVKNGELLRRAVDHFDVMLTADRSIEFQQNLQALPIAVVVLVAASNRLESLEPLLPDLLRVLTTLQPKTFVRVGA